MPDATLRSLERKALADPSARFALLRAQMRGDLCVQLAYDYGEALGPPSILEAECAVPGCEERLWASDCAVCRYHCPAGEDHSGLIDVSGNNLDAAWVEEDGFKAGILAPCRRAPCASMWGVFREEE